MTPALRKLNLTAHIVASVGWAGAVASFLVLGIAGLTSENAGMVRAAYLAMSVTAWFVILPFAFASLLTGLIQSLGTEWGLFRHYWILTKLVLTVFATVILLLKMSLISHVANVAAVGANFGGDQGARTALLVHAGGGLLVLLTAATLSVYKPWGLTGYGRRKRQERREAASGIPVSIPATLSAPDEAMTGNHLPVRIRILLAVAGALVAAIIVLHLSGGIHGSHAR